MYPEVHFSYKDEDEADKEVAVWMNGTADLILQLKDGSYLLIDYKSDNDYLLTEADMGEVLAEKYTPQLSVYRGVIGTMLGAAPEKIRTGIISFSQKDETGSLLTGDQVRVRFTEINE